MFLSCSWGLTVEPLQAGAADLLNFGLRSVFYFSGLRLWGWVLVYLLLAVICCSRALSPTPCNILFRRRPKQGFTREGKSSRRV